MRRAARPDLRLHEGHVGELDIDDRFARSRPDLRHLGGLKHLRGPELPYHHGTHDRTSLPE